MEKCWEGKWITDKDFDGREKINVFHKGNAKHDLTVHSEKLKNHHMLARKKFHIHKIIETAFIDITADDYYKLYINNRFVGQGPAPGYHFHYYFNRFDISEFLHEGDNIIAVHGYYQGLINRVWTSGDYRQGITAQLFVNNELSLVTDSQWKYKRAEEFLEVTETYGYETQYIENIDNRLKENNWKEVSYDDGLWLNAVESACDDHELFLQPTPPLDVYDIKPQKIDFLKDGRYIIDFGHEITGQFQMKAQGNAGEVVTIRCGEELNDEEHVRYKMRCNCNYSDKWILSGKEDTLEFYDYKAFRYVELEAPKDVLNTNSFSATVRHYPMKDSQCSFEVSSPLLKNIWEMCKNGVKYGTQEVYVDCPSREKGQYLGDATVTTHSQIYLTGDLRLFKKTLYDFSLSSFICKGLMSVVPASYMQEIADFSLQWPLQLLNYYMQSGDIEFLKQMYPIAEGIEKYFRQYERQDGLLENVKDKWNLVDWPINQRDGYDFDLSPIVGDGCHNVVNAFYCGMVKIINEIRDILNITYSDRFSELKTAYINTFYKKDIKLFADSSISSHPALHSNVIPLFYGLVPDEAVRSVVDLIREKKLCCGVYISYFVLKGLAKAGEYKLLYELITSEDEHSWANMLREGATTCFEVWGKDQKGNTSLCHPWASSPISVIIEDIIGLKPGKPGWEEVLFDPHIPEDINKLHLVISTIKGKIKVEYENGIFNIQQEETYK